MKVPAATLRVLLSVRVMEDPAANETEGAETVRPLGMPVSEKESGALNAPSTEPHDTATEVDWPAERFTLVGLAVRVHEAGSERVSVTAAVWVTPPPVALIVNG